MNNQKFRFDVLIDDSLLNVTTNNELTPIDKKFVLSIVNDFEDGQWRSAKFHHFIWDNLALTALSAKERQALYACPDYLIGRAAQNLRLADSAAVTEGSELAEILLYGIMCNYYNALPIVPKIYYKQNTNDNAKGADSVHIILTENDFEIWFGEAKFYNDIANARLNSVIASIKNSLCTDKIRKENSIIVELNELKLLIPDVERQKEIIELLDQDRSIDSIKPKLHIPILLLHECEITAGATSLTDEYKTKIIEYHKERATAFFTKQLAALKDEVYLYEQIHFHLILFPVPEKQKIVTRFLNRVRVVQEGEKND